MSVLVSVGFSFLFAAVRGAVRLVSHEGRINTNRALSYFTVRVKSIVLLMPGPVPVTTTV